ncbi:MAG: hypothetical protein ACI358_05595 [Candidatus Limimorpha sp.]
MIKNGDLFQIKNVWDYIPINTASRQQINNLENGLLPIFRREFPTLQNLDSLPDQEVAEVISIHYPDINKVYKEIFKKSNKSSMCLYSGGVMSDYYRMKVFNIHCWCPRCYHNPHFYDFEACLYTGDADLKDMNLTNAINRLLGKRTKRIGTIQIPHHGSKYNSDVQSMDGISGTHPVLLFTSFGTTNKYRHPSLYLLNQLRCAGYYVHEVTEFKHTFLIEVITTL